MKYNDDIIAEIDKEMGWDDPPGTGPATIAKQKGYHCKFLDGPLSATAWYGPDKVWSLCVLSGIETTLLAKSFTALERMYRTLQKRANNLNNVQNWKIYYHNMWKKRYQKWICGKSQSCRCQLCRARDID